MPIIELRTEIQAPAEICFDLSRSIDLHKRSTQHTQEEAVAGITSGLIGLNETVTWRAKHFDFWLQLTSRITEFKRSEFFVDEMVEGIFKSMRHEHHFHYREGKTVMADLFAFQSPLGWLGEIVNQLVLMRYMTRFLEKRNRLIKEVAESEEWKKYL